MSSKARIRMLVVASTAMVSALLGLACSEVPQGEDAGPRRDEPERKALQITSAALAGEVIEVSGDTPCPNGYTLVSAEEARANQSAICNQLGTWNIARLAGSGSIDGPQYGCRIRDYDARSLDFSVCKRVEALIKTSGDGMCPNGHSVASPLVARANQSQLCQLLGPWDIARLAGGGSMRGEGYNCEIRDSAPGAVEHTICAQLSFIDVAGDGPCAVGWTLLSPEEARARSAEACSKLDTWDIARLAGGGSLSGPGYNCIIRDWDTQDIGDALCKSIEAPAAPVITAPQEGALVNTPQPTIRGTAKPGSTIVVWLDGTAEPDTDIVVGQGGEWSMTPVTLLAQGSHQVAATAEDAAGNITPSSEARGFTVDLTKPAAPELGAPEPFVNSQSPSISGVAEAGSTVTVWLDGSSVGTVTAPPSGGWSLPTTALVEGPHEVTATATDAAGNISPPSLPLLFMVDLTMPGAPELRAPEAFVNTQRPTISGLAEADSTVTVRIDGAQAGTATANASGGWNFDPPALAEGPHEITTAATDAAGNISAQSEPRGFTVDLTKPETPTVAGPAAFVTTSRPTIHGAAEPESTVEVWLDGTKLEVKLEAGTSGTWALTPSSDLPTGRHVVSAIATDKATNESPRSADYFFAVQKSHYGWGCTTASASPATWALPALALLLGRRYRARGWSPGSHAGGLSTVAAVLRCLMTAAAPAADCSKPEVPQTRNPYIPAVARRRGAVVHLEPHEESSERPLAVPRLRASGLAALLVLVTACTRTEHPAPSGPAAPAASAQTSQRLFSNGSFEDGTLTGWTVSTNLNPGLTVIPPTSVADLNLQPGGNSRTYARQAASGAETEIPAGLDATTSLRWPKYGNHAAVVNELGNQRNVNRLVQSATIAAADVDPADGKVHVRFALAPVLQNPGHTAEQQPYFYIELRNTTRGTLLWSTFNFANQAGVPWKTFGSGTSAIQYTDWQSVDVAPGDAKLSVGDTVELEVIAAGCQPSGHWGHVYVDGFGSFLPGLSIAATAAQFANDDTDLTYTYLAKNSGSTATSNTQVTIVLPDNTAYVSYNGANCTRTTNNGKDTLTCDLGTLNPTASAQFEVTVHINQGATGAISHGNYSIQATNESPIIGPLVGTNLSAGVPYSDLAITLTDGVSAVAWGDAVQYTMVVTNNGPVAATAAAIDDDFPAQLTGISWTCAGSNGATCATASGSGNIHATNDIPVGGTLTFTVNATVVTGSGSGTLDNHASVSVAEPARDSDTSNNVAVDIDGIGTLYTLTVSKDPAGAGAGTIVSSPSAINCDAGCTSANSRFLEGSQVSLTATAAPGSTFTGWSGACASQPNPCVIDINAATNVEALFILNAYPIISSTIGGNGTISCPTPVGHGQSATCTITPESGSVLTTLTDNYADVYGNVTGNTYVISNVTEPHDVVATFSVQKVLGTSCGRNSECLSNVCADGVCCNSACDGQCEACDVTGSVGTCSAVTGAPHAGHDACASDGSVCGGFCNGTHRASCTYPGASTECRVASCSSGVATAAASCDGAGACPPAQTQQCDPYVCGPNACLDRCTTDVDCAGTLVCGAGACTVDTTPPPPPVVRTPANSSTIFDITPDYTGTAEPNSTITVLVDGEEIGTTQAEASGVWSFTQPTPLPDGPYKVKAHARDAAGNVSASTTSTFTVDTTRRSHYGWNCATAPALSTTWVLLLVGLLRRRSCPGEDTRTDASGDRLKGLRPLACRGRGPRGLPRGARPGSGDAAARPGTRSSSGAGARGARSPPASRPGWRRRSRRWPACPPRR